MTVFQTNDTERMLQQVGEKREAIRVAAGCRTAELVLKNASYVNKGVVITKYTGATSLSQPDGSRASGATRGKRR